MYERFRTGVFLAVIPASAAAVLFTAPHASAAPFDPTQANVLREYDVSTGTRQTSPSSGFRSGRTLDGGPQAANPKAQTGFRSPGFNVYEWNLAGDRTLGSFSVLEDGSFNNYDVTVEYEDSSGNLQTWDTYTRTSELTKVDSPDAGTITTDRVRATFPIQETDPNASGVGRYAIKQVDLFLDSSVNASATDGYDFLANDNLVSGTGQSDGGETSFVNSNGGIDGARTLNIDNFDGIGGDGGGRAFAHVSFDMARQIDAAFLGSARNSSWANWELYTSNDSSDISDLETLGGNTPSDITGAGWTLQIEDDDGSDIDTFAGVQNPGQFEHALLVFDADGTDTVNVELYGVPEPASLALLGVGGLMILPRRQRR